MGEGTNIVTRNLNRKLRIFTKNKTAQQPKEIDLTDLRGTYNIGPPGEPQQFLIHKRDSVTLPQNGTVNITLFFNEFDELLKIFRDAREVIYNGITIQSGNVPGEVQFMVNVLGYDENGEKSGQIIDGGITNFGANISNQNRAWTSPIVGKSIMKSGGVMLETNAGVQELTDLFLSEIDIKFIETANNILGFIINNWWVHFLLRF